MRRTEERLTTAPHSARSECQVCGCHTSDPFCLNCGSRALVPVPTREPVKEAPPRPFGGRRAGLSHRPRPWPPGGQMQNAWPPRARD